MEAFEKIKMSYKCPKALDELQPCEGNWYCDGCQQMVHDFRGMTEADILDAFKQSGKKLCGIYDTQNLRVLPQRRGWQKWASAAMVALGLGAMDSFSYGQSVPLVGKVIMPKRDTAEKKTYMLGEVAIIEQAHFPGGDVAFQKYVTDHIGYKGTFTGVAQVSFTVKANGSLAHIKIVRGTEPELDAMIVDLCKRSPKWQSIKRNNKAVASVRSVYINFPKKDLTAGK